MGILCSYSTVVRSQNSFAPRNDYLAKMAEILPPAPNASAIARYGGVDIDLSTGTVNKLIELKPVVARELKVPIALQYTSAGIRVNDLPSRVGMGWSLLAGGQISRVVNGKNDLSNNRFVPSFNVQPNPDNTDLTTYYWDLQTSNRDAEPDMFTYNFGGYSGRFLFDHDGSIVTIPASNVKIVKNPQPSNDPSWFFSITTPDGVKYLFGGTINGVSYTESTKIGSSLNFNSFIPNTWVLNKVIHPTGYSVTFSYEENYIDTYQVGISQTHLKIPSNATSLCLGAACVSPEIDQRFQFIQYMTANVVLLKEITTSTGDKVVFSYSSQGYPEKLLNSIVYYNQEGWQVQQYSFSYTLVNSVGNNTVLPFLYKIIEQNAQGQSLNNGHEFSYYNLNDIPSRFSFSQDHWGFYNKKINNTLVPRPSTLQMQNNFPYATADREADAQFAINGLLSFIKYPTGGKDEIIYEPNVRRLASQDSNPYVTATSSITGNSNSAYVQSAATSFIIGYETGVKLVKRCSYTGSTPAPHPGGNIIIKDGSGITVKSVFIAPPAPGAGETIDVEFFNLPVGSYSLYTESQGVDVKTTAELTYRSGTAPNIQPADVCIGGMRIQKTITINGVDNTSIIKRYYYGTLATPTVSTPAFIPTPIYYTPFTFLASIYTNDCNNYVSREYGFEALNYSSLNRLHLYDGKLVKYTSVIESLGGDNFDNGAIEHKFHVQEDIPAQVIRGVSNIESPMTNDSYLSKGETETNTYAKKNGTLVPVSSVIYDYTFDVGNYKEITALNTYGASSIPCLGRNGSNQVVSPVPMIHFFSVNKYFITRSWKYISLKTEKTFDENGLNPVTQVTNYYYDNPVHMMLTREETTSSKGVARKKLIKYAHEFSASGNVYEAMVSKNMIGLPVEETTFNGTQPLYRQKKNYDHTWFADNHLITVSTVEIQKGSGPSETRFRFHQYDTYGNPLSLSKENDARQGIIWGYKNVYPIAQVMNAAASDIAYSSFEEDGKGNWNYSGIPVYDPLPVTGRKVYPLSYVAGVSKSGLSTSATYTVSYWSKTGAQSVNGTTATTGRTSNGWTYYAHKVVNPAGGTITVQGTGNIDELRLYPFNATMTTLAYDPGIGTTSQANEKSHIVYYQYDRFGRVILIRDHDNNILKKFCYNYTGQTEFCTYYFNAQLSQNFTKSCMAGYFGSSHTYTVPAGKYLSPFSQADADLWAQNEITANGQAYANAIGTCTVMCSTSNCTGENKKCVNGVCETGVKIYTSSTQVHGSLWECVYHYKWSDQSVSQNYTEFKPTRCVNVID
jgi:hypothetical protein